MPRPSTSALAQVRLVSFRAAHPSSAPRPTLRAAALGSSAVAQLPSSRRATPSLHRSLHSSRPSRAADSGGGGGPTKSPFQAFVDTLKDELKKSQEMQENLTQLQGEAGKVQDSETMRKMKEAYERARIITSLKENPRLQAAADALKKSGGQVGEAVNTTLKQMEESELIKGLGAISSRLARQLADSTAPVRNTQAYKDFSQTLTDAFDDGGSALRIYTDAEADARTARRIKREARLRKIGRQPPLHDVESAEAIAKAMAPREDVPEPEPEAEEDVKAEEAEEKAEESAEAKEGEAGKSEAQEEGAEATSPKPKAPPPKPRPVVRGYAARTRAVQENAEAGNAVVLRPEPKYKQAWSSFKEENPLMRKLSDMQLAYGESENPVVERLRGITDTIGGWFQENETARVVAAFQAFEPTFTLDGFQRDLREYIVPEVIDSYHGAARHLLRQWCGEATYNVLMATIDPYVQKGNTAHGRLLDLKNIEILQAKMLENNVPVLIVSFSSQELMYFKDPKTGEVVAGKEDQADLCRYAMVLTRVEEEMDNEITGGWKVVELARRGQAAFL